ncbi:MAG: hypothetical protein IRY85_01405 [Micromonosporaceae bacterium]|nr:hypothetical protein [Micromonosporaceae bacterium]
MREFDELASAFTELEAFVRDTSRLPGLAAAQAEADRRRRGCLAVWSAAAAVVLVLAGAATVVAGWLPRSGLPGQEPTPSTSVTTGPTPSTSVTTGPIPTTALADLTPSAQLRNAAFDVPAFDLAGCPSGRVQFQDGVFGSVDSGGQLVMDVAAFGDVDGDGNADVVVALTCTALVGNHGEKSTQVLAYSGPARSVLGPITGGQGTMVTTLQVHRDGEVDVGLALVSSPRIQILSIAFDRYRWSGSGFERVDHVDVGNEGLPGVTVTTSAPGLGLTPGGPAQTVEVTVRNDGPSSSRLMRLDVATSAPISIQVEGLATSVDGPRHSLLIATPDAGQTVTIALRVALPAGATLPAGSSILATAWGAYLVEESSASISLIPA